MAGMKWSRLYRNRWLVMLHDLAWVPLTIFIAFWLRFNLEEIPANYLAAMNQLMLFALPVQLAAFWYFGLYRAIWRFSSVPDLIRILRAVGFGALLTFAVLFVWQRLADVPRSVMVLYPVFLAMGLAGPRLLYRRLKEHRLNLSRIERKPTLIVGAGQAGELLVRDLLKGGPYEPVGFLDDNPRRLGQEIHGVEILGTLAELEALAGKHAVQVVLLAIPSASNQVVRNVLLAAQRAGIVCRTLPSVADLADGKVEVSKLRDIRIEDLLGRQEVRPDNSGVQAFLTGKHVLVTGAGGSIGSELCRQILDFAPAELVMLEQGEFNLYRIDGEVQKLAGDVPFAAVLGDIRDADRLRWVFEHYRPQVVFHAAAYKHVPLVEANPAEGVKTNVLGTCQLADLADEFQVEKFIMVSTDKAVNPANVMGATKRAAEIYCQNLNSRSATAFVTTRFGNVLGSAGSVVPLFEKQIRAGGPVTVTHPEITRYFMTIPEAVSLILQAAAMGEGGEIFVLDMGEPVKIADLAEQMIRLAGFEPGVDIEIAYTGLRPGEKLYEELFHDAEPPVGTSHPKIMLAASRQVDWQELQRLRGMLAKACVKRDVIEIVADLRQLVPEFQPAAVETSGPAAGEVLH